MRRDEYFDRSEIYGADGRAYEDNAERFIFFSKATAELARRVIPSPDIIHVHDWQTALIPVFVRQRQLPFKTVLTIHNIAYQGSFWGFDFGLTNLPGSYFTGSGVDLQHSQFEGDEFSGDVFGPGISFGDSDVSGVDFTGSDLTGVDFTDASVQYSTNFTDADLTGADFTGANVSDAIWSNTVCPDGSNSDTNGSSPPSCVGYGI